MNKQKNEIFFSLKLIPFLLLFTLFSYKNEYKIYQTKKDLEIIKDLLPDFKKNIGELLFRSKTSKI